MKLALFLLEIIVCFSMSHSMRLERGPLRPGMNGYNVNRPSHYSYDGRYPTNWNDHSDSDDTGFEDTNPLYCTKIDKKITIDEQVYTFPQCMFDGDSTNDDDNGYSQNYFRMKNPSASHNRGPQNMNYLGQRNGLAQGNGKSSLPPRSHFQASGDSEKHPQNAGYSDDLRYQLLMQSAPSQFTSKLSTDNNQYIYDQLKNSKGSKEIINNQLDRDRIIELLNTKNKGDSSQYESISKYHLPSEYVGKGNSQSYQPSSFRSLNTNKDMENTTSKTLLDDKDLSSKSNLENNPPYPQGSDNSMSGYYQYLSNLQNAPNNQYNQMLALKYPGFQSNPFNSNTFSPENDSSNKSSNKRQVGNSKK